MSHGHTPPFNTSLVRYARSARLSTSRVRILQTRAFRIKSDAERLAKRWRGYVIHIAGAKQAQTRVARIEKCKPKILAGQGFNEPH